MTSEQNGKSLSPARHSPFFNLFFRLIKQLFLNNDRLYDSISSYNIFTLFIMTFLQTSYMPKLEHVPVLYKLSTAEFVGCAHENTQILSLIAKQLILLLLTLLLSFWYPCCQ